MSNRRIPTPRWLIEHSRLGKIYVCTPSLHFGCTDAAMPPAVTSVLSLRLWHHRNQNCIFTQVLIPTTFVCIALMPNTSLSPRWARLQKVEEIETDQYFIDVYVCPVTTEELREKYLNEPPVLYAFAVFDKQNTYLLSYALEMREAIRILPDETEETYIGYFLEAFCEHQHFTCKNFKEIEPDLETVRTTVISFVVEYNAVEKMLEYDREVSQNQSKVNDNPS
jgi:hypothetical protein